MNRRCFFQSLLLLLLPKPTTKNFHYRNLVSGISTHGGYIQDGKIILDRPVYPPDVWEAVDQLTNQFNKRVGLTDLMYGDFHV